MAKSVAERRRHKRYRVPCPASLLRAGKGSQKEEAVQARAVDLSDGGAMLAVPIKAVPHVSEKVRVVLNVPRETPNTRMLEEFSCEARIVRHQMLVDNSYAGVALQFVSTQPLALEV